MLNDIIWAIVLITFVTILSPPTVLLLAIGMLPTGVAYICDKSDEKYAALCVGGLNLCGVFPYVLSVWFDYHSINQAFEIISNLFSVMIIYSAAGLGWMFFRYVPPVISHFLNFIAKRRLAHLKNVQNELIDEWGAHVGGIKPNLAESAEEELNLDSENSFSAEVQNPST